MVRLMDINANTLRQSRTKGVWRDSEQISWHIDPTGQWECLWWVPCGDEDLDERLSAHIRYRERRQRLGRHSGLLRFMVNLPGAVLATEREARRFRPDVIRVGDLHAPALIALLAPSLRGVPKLCYIAGDWEDLLTHQVWIPKYLRPLIVGYYRRMYRVFDLYTAAPAVFEEAFVSRGMARSRIRGWLPHVDWDKLDSPHGRAMAEGLLSDIRMPRPWLVSVARLHPEKRVLDAWKAFRDMCKMGFSGSLVLVGDGPLRAFIEAESRANGLEDRIAITGDVPIEVGFALVQECDIYLATYHGSALLEAMGAGIPIVATDAAFHDQFIDDGKTGLISDPSPAAMANAAMRLVNDESMRKRLGAQARMWIRKTWSKDRQAALLAAPIEELAARSPHAVRR